jgi:hypothetical protein
LNPGSELRVDETLVVLEQDRASPTIVPCKVVNFVFVERLGHEEKEKELAEPVRHTIHLLST